MSEKTEKATPKQLRDAREKGQVGQSQDLAKLLVLLVVVLDLVFVFVQMLVQQSHTARITFHTETDVFLNDILHIRRHKRSNCATAATRTSICFPKHEQDTSSST